MTEAYPTSLFMKHMASTSNFYSSMELTSLIAGFTYCAIGALSLLDRLPLKRQDDPSWPVSQNDATTRDSHLISGLGSPQRTVDWLIARLTATIEDDDFKDDDEERSTPTSSQKLGAPPNILGVAIEDEVHEPSFSKIRSTPASDLHSGPLRPSKHIEDIPSGMLPICWLGFNGRCNKTADTCYAWWAGGSLKVCQGVLTLYSPLYSICGIYVC